MSEPLILETITRALAGDAMKIQIPDAFYDYCIWLHQDSEYDYGPSPEAMIVGALKRIGPEQRQPLRDFVQELLTGPYSETDLVKTILSANADIAPRGPDGARQFLTYLRDLIDGKHGPVFDR